MGAPGSRTWTADKRRNYSYCPQRLLFPGLEFEERARPLCSYPNSSERCTHNYAQGDFLARRLQRNTVSLLLSGVFPALSCSLYRRTDGKTAKMNEARLAPRIARTVMSEFAAILWAPSARVAILSVQAPKAGRQRELADKRGNVTGFRRSCC